MVIRTIVGVVNLHAKQAGSAFQCDGSVTGARTARTARTKNSAVSVFILGFVLSYVHGTALWNDKRRLKKMLKKRMDTVTLEETL